MPVPVAAVQLLEGFRDIGVKTDAPCAPYVRREDLPDNRMAEGKDRRAVIGFLDDPCRDRFIEECEHPVRGEAHGAYERRQRDVAAQQGRDFQDVQAVSAQASQPSAYQTAHGGGDGQLAFPAIGGALVPGTTDRPKVFHDKERIPPRLFPDLVLQPRICSPAR
jgi:hypothetical protein